MRRWRRVATPHALGAFDALDAEVDDAPAVRVRIREVRPTPDLSEFDIERTLEHEASRELEQEESDAAVASVRRART